MLIEIVAAALLVLGSALVFRALFEADAPETPASRRQTPAEQEFPPLRKAA